MLAGEWCCPCWWDTCFMFFGYHSQGYLSFFLQSFLLFSCISSNLDVSNTTKNADMELLVWWNMHKNSTTTLRLCHLSCCSWKKCNFLDFGISCFLLVLLVKLFYIIHCDGYAYLFAILSSEPFVVTCILEQFCCIRRPWRGGFYLGSWSSSCSHLKVNRHNGGWDIKWNNCFRKFWAPYHQS